MDFRQSILIPKLHLVRIRTEQTNNKRFGVFQRGPEHSLPAFPKSAPKSKPSAPGCEYHCALGLVLEGQKLCTFES
jgi:hypothetical protein